MSIEIVQGWGVPQGAARDFRSPFLRIPAGHVLSVVLLSEVPVRYYGHWSSGGVRPCGDPICELCDEGVGRQERYVFDCFHCDDDRTAVWECSRTLAFRMRELAGEPASMRGSCWKVWKAGEKAGSRTEVELWTGGELWCISKFGLLQGSSDTVPEVDLPVGRGASDVLRRWWSSRGWLRDLSSELSSAGTG